LNRNESVSTSSWRERDIDTDQLQVLQARKKAVRIAVGHDPDRSPWRREKQF
jgi:hypothetical protein